MTCPGCGMWVNRGNPHACGVAHSCPHCGFWVNPHESHVCGPMPLGGPTSSFEAQRVATALESINILLAQVRDSLIKLATIAEQRLEFDMADYVDEPDPNQPVPGP